MPLLPPIDLTQIWSVTPAAIFGSLRDVQLGDGGLLRAGVSGSDLGCLLVACDPDTGEPLFTDTHVMVASVADPDMLGVYHFPAENAVVLFASNSPGTLTSHRVYGQRVEYDLGTGTLTAGPLATWTPNLSGINAKTEYAGDVPDSSTINVLGWGPFNFTMSTLDLAAGSASASVDYTVDSICGGGRNRTQVGVANVNFPGAIMIDAYVNSAGAGTGVAFHIPFTSTPGAATDLGLGRNTSVSRGTAYGTERSLITAGFDGGADAYYFLDATTLTAGPSGYDVIDDPSVTTSTVSSMHNGSPFLLTLNGESPGAQFNVRLFGVESAVEQGAWQYDTGGGPRLGGMLTSNRRFWWDVDGTDVRIWEDLDFAPSQGKWGRVRWGS